jgi:MFS family permease
MKTLAVFRFNEFRNYIICRFFFILVMNMQATLISWEVYDMTKDPFSIGLIGLFEFVPAMLMSLFSGQFIDKNDKKYVLQWSILMNILLSVGLLVATLPYTSAALGKSTTLIVIYTVVFFTGIARAFSGPASFAMVSQLIPEEHLNDAVTWNSASWQIAVVMGPTLAGLMYGHFGITPTFCWIIGLFLISFVAILFVGPKPAAYVELKETIFESIKQGFQFVWRTKEILGTLTLDLFAVFFGGATAMLPYYADVVLKVGPAGLGLLRSVPAIGSLVVLLMITLRPLKKQQGKTMLWCVAGFGVSIIVFGLSQIFWLSVVALFASGVLDGISMIIRSNILQLKTPDAMRGRVASLNSIFVMSSNELGEFESGFTSKLMGVVPAVIFGGCMTVLIVAATWIKNPAIKKIKY